jgi:dTDP-glucose pyrophosphorylase
MIMTQTLIILAAGASSRMKKSLADSQQSGLMVSNKALIALGSDKTPALDFLLHNAYGAGFKNVILVVAPEGLAFKERYGLAERGNSYKGLSIAYAYQHIPEGHVKPLGTADALLQTLKQHPDVAANEFVLCNADNLYSVAALERLRLCSAPNAMMSYARNALLFPIAKIRAFALLVVNAKQQLIQLEEKPDQQTTRDIEQRMGKLLVSMNLWKFNGPNIMQALERCPLHPTRQEKELPVAVQLMISDLNHAVHTLEIAEHVPDLTTAEDIALVEKQLGLNP